MQSVAILTFSVCSKVRTELDNVVTIPLSPVLWIKLKEPETQAHRQAGSMGAGLPSQLLIPTLSHIASDQSSQEAGSTLEKEWTL